MKTVEELREYDVAEDSRFIPMEKEYYIRGSAEDTSKVKITSKLKSFTKHMLKCDDLEVTNYHINENGEIIYLEGNLPISYLKYKTEGRTRNYLSTMLVD